MTLDSAGIVNVLALLSAIGCRMVLPASAKTAVYAADWELIGVFLNPTASVPSTVQLLSCPDVGVPRTGVTNVGVFAKTRAPVPVSSVTAAAKLAEDGVPKKVATPVPKDVMPVPPEATGNAAPRVREGM